MATCSASISATTFSAIEVINPSTVTPIGAINTTTNKLFRFTITSSNTISFTIKLAQTSGALVNAQVSIYRYDGPGAIISMGSVALSNPSTSFVRDFESGSYVICIRQITGSYTGTIVGTFSAFPSTALMSAVIRHGETFYSNTGTIDVPSRINCDDPLYFTILDGKLPPGLQMSQLGMISGTLPNLDCLEETTNLSPSTNWYFRDMDGAVQPWGFQWRFKVRVYLSTNHAIYADEWFCIMVHNNWSLDRDNFLANAPFERFRQIEIVQDALKLPDTVCYMPCDQVDADKIFDPTPILEAKCPTCDASKEVNVELVPLPPVLKSKPASEIAKWFAQYGGREFESTEMNEFVKTLQASEAWRLYMAGEGFGDTDTTTLSDLIVSVATNGDGNLQISVIDPVEDENDLDVMLERMRIRENQKLPITVYAWTGEALTADLWTTNDIGKYE